MEPHSDSLVRLDVHPARAVLRSFGIALAVVCFARAWFAWSSADSLGQSTWCALAGLIAMAVALLRPSLLRGLYIAIGVLSYPVRWLAAFSILALLYFAVISPLALVTRLTRRSQHHASGSAWHACAARGDKADYFRQF
jgi:hypothetical protein